MLPEQQMLLLSLYDEEIIKRIAINHAKADMFSHLLPSNEYRGLMELYEFSWITFAEKLWKQLWEAPTRNLLYTTVLTFLCECDKKLHRRLLCIDYSCSLLDFMAFLKYSKEFFDVIKPTVVSEKLAGISEHHAELMLPVKSITERQGEISAKKYILRSIPDMGEGAFYDLLDAVTACGDDGREFVARIYPNFQRYYRLFLHERGKVERGKVYFCQLEKPLADVIMESKSDKRNKEHLIDLRFQHFPSNGSDAVEEDMYEGEVIVLRKYQEELAKPAYDGQNTLICAPTGTGKTVVAASIAKRHLILGRRNNLHTKVCFFVTNTTFLEQQAKLLEKFVAHRWKVTCLSGMTVNTPVEETIETYDVIIITPQLIVNLLNLSGRDGSFQFSLSSFSLMLFDEAHHADANHPYNVIMNAYHEMKRTGNLQTGKRLPQIIGLTASLGIGNAQSATEAVDHFVKMCANLDIEALSFVRENIDELDLYSSVAVDETKLIVSDLSVDPVAAKIINLMRRFEGVLHGIADKHLVDSHFGCSNQLVDMLCKLQKPPGNKCTKGYETWFSQLLVKAVPEAEIEKGERVRIMMCLQYIEILYRTLEQYVHFPLHVASKYFENEYSILKPTTRQEFLDIVQAGPFDSIADNFSNNELFDALLHILHIEFTTKNEGRAIVFVKMRDFAVRLAEQLNGDEGLKLLGVKSDYVTGVNAPGEVGGQSVSEQRDTLVRFADGDIKILCATSVAEEGIDIRKCNLVIKYNYVTNEIAHIQRRGRGRAADSRCILLTSDPKLQEREEKNIIREKIMRKALKLIGEKSPTWFREEVAKCVQKNAENRISGLVIDERINEPLSRSFKLLCKKCDALICTSNDIVVTSAGTQYLCVCKEIWERSRQYPYSKSRMQLEERYLLKGVGSLCCAKSDCGHLWGRVVRCNGVRLPVIAAEAFVLVSESGERFQKRRWKQVVEKFFKPRGIELYDYAMMNAALPVEFENVSLRD